ncbi:hypothetical protein EYC84_001520 [Monilinia fructicola]|uniref:Disease resistance R13L4/SHOC-2-like LRR domain-containing protein n=1 Tax=Monilinia fructicola TaxID=38448 RepID=A0A5M9JSD1_MONFR|nr:hypothetical protein EYC84_001520 [Monilinia fructicola]
MYFTTRYLNVRNNIIREFPLAICQLTSLEILDLGRNKLRILPPDIINLTSLKVLSVQKNRIEELPLCVADMTSLQVLKLDGNPLRFPPKEVLQPQPLNSPIGGPSKKVKIEDITVTTQIKRFLKHKAMGRPETESGEKNQAKAPETQRPTVKRVPRALLYLPDRIKEGFRNRTQHFDGPVCCLSLSEAQMRGFAATARASCKPTVIAQTRSSVDRSRRMGIVSRKAAELGTVDETNRSNRYSLHNRGLSHGSAMQGNSIGSNGNTMSQQAQQTPLDELPMCAAYQAYQNVNENLLRHPIIEGAKVYYQDVQRYDSYSEEDEEASPRSNENVKRPA